MEEGPSELDFKTPVAALADRCFSPQASRMTISKLASDVAENHWETKGMKHALQAERDYNLMTTQKLERLKVRTIHTLEQERGCEVKEHAKVM